MKRLMAISALALASVSCVANQGDAPIRFLDARGLSGNVTEPCAVSDELVRSGGSIDVAGGQLYLLAMSVESNNASQPIIINQENFSGAGLSDITLNEIVYSYQFQPITEGLSVSGLPADDEERIPHYSVVRPGTSAEESFIFMNAFGPKAFKTLRSIPVGSEGTLFTTIKARGRLSGGQPVESNKFTFPIIVYNSGASYSSCPAGQVAAGVCRAGQDTNGAGCVAAGS